MASTISPLYAINNTAVTVTDMSVISPQDSEEIRQVQIIFEVAMAINKYYLWPLFVLGFPGNLAAIITIFHMRSIGTYPVFVVLLAVIDSLAILVKLLFYQLLYYKVDMGTTGCCLLRFLGSWSSAYSSWILVFMALERFVAIRFPLKMTLYNGCNTNKVMAVLAIVGFVIAIIYVPQLWTSEISRTKFSLQCQYKAEYEPFMNSEYFWISVSTYAFVPFCLLTVFNCLLARQIRRSLQPRKVVRNTSLTTHYHQGCSNVSAHRQRPDRNFHAIQSQVNLMLLTTTVVFIILTCPICLFMIADHRWTVTPGYTRSNAVKFLCQQLAFVLVDSTHAVNFYLYFLTARRFRHHFLRLVTFKKCYCRIKSLCQQAKGSNQSELEDL